MRFQSFVLSFFVIPLLVLFLHFCCSESHYSFPTLHLLHDYYMIVCFVIQHLKTAIREDLKLNHVLDVSRFSCRSLFAASYVVESLATQAWQHPFILPHKLTITHFLVYRLRVWHVCELCSVYHLRFWFNLRYCEINIIFIAASKMGWETYLLKNLAEKRLSRRRRGIQTWELWLLNKKTTGKESHEAFLTRQSCYTTSDTDQ